MLEKLRKPFFFAALGVMVLVLLVEAGSGVMLSGGSGDSPPGRGISYLMLVDGIVLFTVSLMAISLVVRERIQGRVQGVATFIFSLLLTVISIVLITVAVAELILMVSLLTSAPFGTAAYMSIYGSFDRAGAAVVLGILMTLKFAFVVLLIVAHQRFLQNKGLVVIIITSFVATVIVSFLHGIVPRFMVSITDAIAAIIVAILAVVWALVLLFGSLRSVAKALGI